MQNIRNIIFDYGNVIFAIDFGKAQQAFSDLGIRDVAGIYAHKNQDPLFDDFDRGMISSAGFRDGIRRLAGNPELTDGQIDRAWNALLLGVPEGNHELLLQCREKYHTFLLSNNNEIHYTWILDHLQNEYGLQGNDSFFEKSYYSHLVGMRKPAPEIFELVIRENNLLPDETLFIDDSPQHLDAARKFGIQTALLSSPKELGALLQGRGLL